MVQRVSSGVREGKPPVITNTRGIWSLHRFLITPTLVVVILSALLLLPSIKDITLGSLGLLASPQPPPPPPPPSSPPLTPSPPPPPPPRPPSSSIESLATGKSTLSIMLDMANTTPSKVPAATANDNLNNVESLEPTTDLSYLAEGAANVIYRISSPQGAPQYHNQLLRLRKALPSAQPNKLAYEHLLHTFHPLFPSHLLLPTTLIRIPNSILVRENAGLRTAEETGRRPAKRQGLYLEEVKEEFGFLIMDMSPHPLPTPPPTHRSPLNFLSRALALLPGYKRRPKELVAPVLPAHAQQTRQLLIEFKPKWIIQSPSAPNAWRRCRTCALRLSKAQKHTFCPLDLSSSDEPRVRRAVQYLIPAKKPGNLQLAPGVTWEATQKIIADRTVRYLVESELMPYLKKLHAELDPYGPVAIETMDKEHKDRFITAMTVRDLTIFLRIDLDAKDGDKKGVDARIGDLDLKTGDAGKWSYWADVERKLAEGGLYNGTEEGADEKEVWCKP